MKAPVQLFLPPHHHQAEKHGLDKNFEKCDGIDGIGTGIKYTRCSIIPPEAATYPMMKSTVPKEPAPEFPRSPESLPKRKESSRKEQPSQDLCRYDSSPDVRTRRILEEAESIRRWEIENRDPEDVLGQDSYKEVGDGLEDHHAEGENNGRARVLHVTGLIQASHEPSG
jgi:hypothetical protein